MFGLINAAPAIKASKSLRQISPYTKGLKIILDIDAFFR